MFLEDATLKLEDDQIDQEEDLNDLQELALLPSDRTDIQEAVMEVFIKSFTTE